MKPLSFTANVANVLVSLKIHQILIVLLNTN